MPTIANSFLEENGLEEVKAFTYLSNIVNIHGGRSQSTNWHGKSSRSPTQKHIESQEIATQTKIGIFNSNVKSVLLYGSERTTKNTTRKVQTFINNCLPRTLKIPCPETISNLELWQQTKQGPIKMEIKRK